MTSREEWDRHPSLWTQDHLADFALNEGGAFKTNLTEYSITKYGPNREISETKIPGKLVIWHFDPAFPVARFGDPEKWAAWYREEKIPGLYDYFEELEAAWIKDPIEVAPVILIDGSGAPIPDGDDGWWDTFVPSDIDLGDGFHRVAISMKYGLETIPAVVGEIVGK